MNYAYCFLFLQRGLHGSLFVSQKAAVLKLGEKGVKQKFVTANCRSTREIFVVVRKNNCIFITSCILGSILKMEVVCSTEMLLPACQTTWC
jgi:hypothetical protein